MGVAPKANGLRIGVVGPAHPYRGGIAQFQAVLCSELKARDCELRVFNFSRQYPSFLFPGKTQTTDSRPALAVESERTLDSLNPVSWFRTYFKLKAFKPDAVLFSWWTPFFAPCFWTIAFLLRRFGGIRVAYICHNVIPHERRLGDLSLTRLALGQADVLVLLSKQSEGELTGLLPRARYAVVYLPRYSFFQRPGLTREKARAKLGVDRRMLLFFGYVRPYKGLGILLEGFGRYAGRDAQARLLVVGEFYESREPYEEKVRALGLSDRVSFVDRYVSDEEVADYFVAADLLVLPYLSATQSAVIQIAQSFELPVVTTNVGGLPEVVEEGETGFLVPPGDPDALAEAIDRFFKEGWRERMRPRLRKAAGRFSWDPLVESVVRFASEGAAERERGAGVKAAAAGARPKAPGHGSEGRPR